MQTKVAHRRTNSSPQSFHIPPAAGQMSRVFNQPKLVPYARRSSVVVVRRFHVAPHVPHIPVSLMALVTCSIHTGALDSGHTTGRPLACHGSVNPIKNDLLIEKPNLFVLYFTILAGVTK